MIDQSVIVGIITYNPDLNVLKLSIESLVDQNCFIVIVDNNSINHDDLLKMIHSLNYSYIDIILNNTNKGIAAALNQVMSVGMKKGAEWVLTLDQDSICEKDYIASMKKYFYVDSNIAMVAPVIIDRNVGTVGHNPKTEISLVRTCITSGAFTKVRCWEEIGGYDEKMFIDSVDFEFCYRLRKAGYKVIQTSKIKLSHSLGDGKIIRLLGLKIKISEHNAFRCYYIAKNNIYYPLKHHLWLHLIRGNFRNLKHIIMIVIFETGKAPKIKAVFKGWVNGYTC